MPEKKVPQKITLYEKFLAEISKLPRSKNQPDTTKMVFIPAGKTIIGANNSQSRKDEYPKFVDSVKGYWIDKTEVTNKQFSAFVKATGYITTAERKIKVNNEMMEAGSIVFNEKNPKQWWLFKENVNWKQPYGPSSNIDNKDNHPVVHVSWYDAMAYAHWSGKRLPKEVEWEYAARGGIDNQIYFWGNNLTGGEKYANFHQGDFPINNTIIDGYEQTAPVKSYLPNNFGLYDMAGNVWEWCLDTYYEDAYSRLKNRRDGYFDRYYNDNQQKVIRGGSFLCSESYCSGYRLSSRMSSTPYSSLEHTGFRCVYDKK
jgi:formylglycine-generating enzyme required for sulfatase activity